MSNPTASSSIKDRIAKLNLSSSSNAPNPTSTSPGSLKTGAIRKLADLQGSFLKNDEKAVSVNGSFGLGGRREPSSSTEKNGGGFRIASLGNGRAPVPSSLPSSRSASGSSAYNSNKKDDSNLISTPPTISRANSVSSMKVEVGDDSANIDDIDINTPISSIAPSSPLSLPIVGAAPALEFNSLRTPLDSLRTPERSNSVVSVSSMLVETGSVDDRSIDDQDDVVATTPTILTPTGNEEKKLEIAGLGLTDVGGDEQQVKEDEQERRNAVSNAKQGLAEYQNEPDSSDSFISPAIASTSLASSPATSPVRTRVRTPVFSTYNDASLPPLVAPPLNPSESQDSIYSAGSHHRDESEFDIGDTLMEGSNGLDDVFTTPNLQLFSPAVSIGPTEEEVEEPSREEEASLKCSGCMEEIDLLALADHDCNQMTGRYPTPDVPSDLTPLIPSPPSPDGSISPQSTRRMIRLHSKSLSDSLRSNSWDSLNDEDLGNSMTMKVSEAVESTEDDNTMAMGNSTTDDQDHTMTRKLSTQDILDSMVTSDSFASDSLPEDVQAEDVRELDDDIPRRRTEEISHNRHEGSFPVDEDDNDDDGWATVVRK